MRNFISNLIALSYFLQLSILIHTKSFLNDHEELNNGSNSILDINDFVRSDLELKLGNRTRAQLIKYAFALDNYHKEVNNLNKQIRGLEDYIWLILDKEIITYIIKETGEHSEIDSIQKLDTLAFGKISDRLKIDAERILRKYMNGLNRDVLTKCAFAIESYHNKVNDINYEGDVKKMIMNQTNSDLIDFMIKELNNHPEIMNNFKKECLDKSVTVNAISSEVNNFEENLYYYDLPILRTFAKTLEKFDELNLQQGEKKYFVRVNSLDKYDTISYIKKMLAKYPETNSIKKLQELTKIYQSKKYISSS